MMLSIRLPFAIALGATVLLLSAEGLTACTEFLPQKSQAQLDHKEQTQLEAIAPLKNKGNFRQCIDIDQPSSVSRKANPLKGGSRQ